MQKRCTLVLGNNIKLIIRNTMKNIQMERIVEDIDKCLNEANLALTDKEKSYSYVCGYLTSVLKTLQFQIKLTLDT